MSASHRCLVWSLLEKRTVSNKDMSIKVFSLAEPMALTNWFSLWVTRKPKPQCWPLEWSIWRFLGPLQCLGTQPCVLWCTYFFFMFLLIKNTFNMWHKHVTQLLACFFAARWCTVERLSDGGLFKKGVQVPCMDGFSVCQNCLIFCIFTPDSFLSLSTHSFISSGVLFFTSTILLLPFTKTKDSRE